MRMVGRLGALLCMGFAAMAPSGAAELLKLEGMSIEDSMEVSGTKLLLNGVGVRKRGYFKTELVALYLPQKVRSLAEVSKLTGPKRIHIVTLKELTGGTLSRYFISDFKVEATEDEFKQLINEVALIGGYYGDMRALNRGDVVNIDWLPDKQGIIAYVNGKPMGVPMKSELMYSVLLRMMVAPSNSTKEYRDALMSRAL